MILNAILYILYVVVYGFTWPIRAFSDVSLDSGFADAIATAGNNINLVSAILPISTLLWVFSLYLAVEGAILTYKGVMWLIKKIPGIN